MFVFLELKSFKIGSDFTLILTSSENQEKSRQQVTFEKSSAVIKCTSIIVQPSVSGEPPHAI